MLGALLLIFEWFHSFPFILITYAWLHFWRGLNCQLLSGEVLEWHILSLKNFDWNWMVCRSYLHHYLILFSPNAISRVSWPDHRETFDASMSQCANSLTRSRHATVSILKFDLTSAHESRMLSTLVPFDFAYLIARSEHRRRTFQTQHLHFLKSLLVLFVSFKKFTQFLW